jgi:acyl-CoA hydrolase
MPIPVVHSHVESTERIQPHQANNYGNAHGGEIVRLMDELAAIAAMRVAGETCVTARISRVDFQNPIPVGHVAELSAYVYDTGSSSLDVEATVRSRDPRKDDPQTTTAARFTMVAVDETGTPTSVPDVSVESIQGERLLDQTVARP